MSNLNLYMVRTAVAKATRTASLSGFRFTAYEAQRLTNPELFVY